jgi:hypothetical protein
MVVTLKEFLLVSGLLMVLALPYAVVIFHRHPEQPAISTYTEPTENPSLLSDNPWSVSPPCSAPTTWRRFGEGAHGRSQSDAFAHGKSTQPPPGCYNRRPSERPLKIGLATFATGRYIQMVPEFIETANKYFFPFDNVTIFLFSDFNGTLDFQPGHTLRRLFVPFRPWPESSMMRFGVLAENQKRFKDLDYIYQLDVDYAFLHFICDEFLGDLVALRHPGHQCSYWNTRETLPFEGRPASTAYVAPEEREVYFMGSQFGGRPSRIHALAEKCRENQLADERNGIMAVWNDESHLNCYFVDNYPTVILSASFCYPQPYNDWDARLSSFFKIAVHRAKDLVFIRNPK